MYARVEDVDMILLMMLYIGEQPLSVCLCSMLPIPAPTVSVFILRPFHATCSFWKHANLNTSQILRSVFY